MIYKYYSDESNYAVENFKNGQICFSHVSQFNDNQEFEIMTEDKNHKVNFKSMAIQQIEEMKFKLRVACFCKSADLENMWGYYANRGKGFCLGYDEKELQLCISNLIVTDVEYSDKLPVLTDKMSADEMIIAQTCHKRKCWQEEQEVRALAFLSDKHFFIQNISLNASDAWKPLVSGVITCELPVFLNNREPCVYYSPENVSIALNPKELILGRKCDKELEQELIRIANIYGIQHRKQGVKSE